MSKTQIHQRTSGHNLSHRVSRISISSTAAVVAEAEKLRSEGVDLIDFGAGEPDFPTPENIKEAAIRAIHGNFSKYTATGGSQELRAAIAYRHATDFGTSYASSEIIATAGGKQAIFNAICSIINPGDEVILPVPYWVTFFDVINYAAGKAVFIETKEEDNFNITAEMVEKAMTPRTRLVVLNSPSNPSGAVVQATEFKKILEVTVRHGAWLMSDECYCQFLYDDQPFSIGSIPGSKDHLILVGSLSKTYAMTGWRIGFAMAPAPLVLAMTKLQSHSTSNPSSVAQKAAVEALTGQQESVFDMLREYRRRRDFIVEKLRDISGVTCTLPGGAFYAYPNVAAFVDSGEHRHKKSAAATPNDLAKRLVREAGVVVVPGEAFGTQHHLRLSYANSLENIGEGLKRMNRYFAE